MTRASTALSVLLSEESADPERRRRFLQEAKAASALNHPNIITIHDVGTDDGIALEEAYRLAPYFCEVAGLLAAVLMRCGELPRAEELVARLKGSDSIQWKAIGLSVFHLMCDEPDAAADWLEIRFEEHYGHSLFFTLWSPMAASLRAGSRGPAMARKMNLPAF